MRIALETLQLWDGIYYPEAVHLVSPWRVPASLSQLLFMPCNAGTMLVSVLEEVSSLPLMPDRKGEEGKTQILLETENYQLCSEAQWLCCSP